LLFSLPLLSPDGVDRKEKKERKQEQERKEQKERKKLSPRKENSKVYKQAQSNYRNKKDDRLQLFDIYYVPVVLFDVIQSSG